jgi:hypothetical protein
LAENTVIACVECTTQFQAGAPLRGDGFIPRTAICQSLSGSRSPFIAAVKILFAISSQAGLDWQLQKL